MADIKLVNLNKSYGQVHILKDVNLEIKSGEFVYQASTSGQIVIVRAAFPMKLYTSFLSGPGLSNLSGNRRMIAAVAAFRNEPF